MNKSLSDLYQGYLKAAEFCNAHVEDRYHDERTRQLFRMKQLTEREFSKWWSEVSRDEELKKRWLDRFEDPAGSHARSVDRIRRCLDQIPIRRVAA